MQIVLFRDPRNQPDLEFCNTLPYESVAEFGA